MSKENIQHKSSQEGDGKQNLPQDQTSTELQQLEELIEVIPEEKQKIIRSLIFSIEERTFWHGPLPPPKTLKEYNEVVSDGAEKIFEMAEKLADHKMDIQKTDIHEWYKQGARGMTYAYRICLAFLIISAILVLQGYELAGTLIGTVDLIGIVTAFILGRRNQNRNPI